MDENEKLKKALAPKTDQLNSDDLITGPLTIKVKKVFIKDSDQQPIEISYEGDNNKPYKPCKSMGRVLGKVWGGPANWIGKSMTLYRDEKVLWAGMEVGGIRISHVSDISEKITMSLTAAKSSRKPFEVKPLVIKSAPKVNGDVLTAGDAAAANGVAAYTKWKDSLTPEVKATIKPHHSGWAAIATAADAKALSEEEEVADDEAPEAEEIPV